MKILVTGGSGMIGRSVCKKLSTESSIPISSSEFDLRNILDARAMLEKYKPDKIIHLAAKVGGISANLNNVTDFYNDNILINTNILLCASEKNIKNVISVLSTCVYPDKEWAKYPLTEDQLHNGPPPESNFAYAYSKRMLEVQSRAYRKQHRLNYACAIPNNVFGPNDNFDLNSGHVIPSIIRKIYEAKISGIIPEFWGTGCPLRQFTYVDDIADCLISMAGVGDEVNVYNETEPCNIGTNEEYSIKEVVDKVSKILKYTGDVIWDASKPEGQFRKPSLSTKIKHTYKSLDDGLKITCKWFENNYPNIRGINIK